MNREKTNEEKIKRNQEASSFPKKKIGERKNEVYDILGKHITLFFLKREL
jgi:hypothetical protein